MGPIRSLKKRLTLIPMDKFLYLDNNIISELVSKNIQPKDSYIIPPSIELIFEFTNGHILLDKETRIILWDRFKKIFNWNYPIKYCGNIIYDYIDNFPNPTTPLLMAKDDFYNFIKYIPQSGYDILSSSDWNTIKTQVLENRNNTRKWFTAILNNGDSLKKWRIEKSKYKNISYEDNYRNVVEKECLAGLLSNLITLITPHKHYSTELCLKLIDYPPILTLIKFVLMIWNEQLPEKSTPQIKESDILDYWHSLCSAAIGRFSTNDNQLKKRIKLMNLPIQFIDSEDLCKC